MSFNSGQSVLTVEASPAARNEPVILKSCLKPLHMCVMYLLTEVMYKMWLRIYSTFSSGLEILKQIFHFLSNTKKTRHQINRDNIRFPSLQSKLINT